MSDRTVLVETKLPPSRGSESVISPAIFNMLDYQASLFDQTVKPKFNMKSALIFGVFALGIVFLVKKVAR